MKTYPLDIVGEQFKVMFGSLRNDQNLHKANPNCPHCEGSGTTWIANGADDVEPEPCACVLNTYQND